MKKILFVLTIALCAATVTFSQMGDENNPRVQEMRVAFFNKHLQFSDAESTAFWPIYKSYTADQKALKKQYRPNRKFELMSDEEAEKFLDDHIQHEEEQLALKKKYIGELKQVLPIRKIAMINRTERQFKKELLKKIQNRREGGGRKRGFN